MKVIIFDFMRTLYDPDKDCLIEDAYPVLEYLSQTHTLFLVSRDEGHREELLDRFQIRDFFQRVYFVPEKTEELFSSIVSNLPKEDIYVVGDRLVDEIAIAHKLGYRSVWFAQGKFANVVPTADFQPWKKISRLKELYHL